MLNNKTLLVTGGTGSFGKEFVKMIYEKYPKIKKLIIFSRDELKQFDMSNIYPISKYKSIRFFLGDVRDKDRLTSACAGVDIIIHAAALKQVPAAEYNPMEFIKTNIIGASNIIDAAIANKVKKVIALSTDKAAAPINLYGATKLCSDKLFVAANNYAGQKVAFSVVRYGNVMNSRGSVMPLFLNNKKNEIFITDKDMTRFTITVREGINFVFKVIKLTVGGEIFLPKTSSYKILDVAKACAPKAKIRFTGIRPGEKIDEELITIADNPNTLEFKNFFIICPSNKDKIYNHYHKKKNGKTLPKNFSYNSRNNSFLKVSDIRDLIKKN